MHEITMILSAIDQGDPDAASQLLPLVYAELRRLAAQRLVHENAGHTLQPTALVHEAYLRLVGQEDDVHWNSRGHFFAAAAEAMRRILVESARRKGSLKRGGNLAQQALDEEQLLIPEPREDLLVLDEALTKLAATNKEAADLVKMRYFAGDTARRGKVGQHIRADRRLRVGVCPSLIASRTSHAETESFPHAKWPEERFNSAQEVADLFGRYIAELQAHGTCNTSPKRTRRDRPTKPCRLLARRFATSLADASGWYGNTCRPPYQCGANLLGSEHRPPGHSECVHERDEDDSRGLSA